MVTDIARLKADITDCIAGIVISMLAGGSACHLVSITANGAVVVLNTLHATSGIQLVVALILMISRYTILAAEVTIVIAGIVVDMLAGCGRILVIGVTASQAIIVIFALITAGRLLPSGADPVMLAGCGHLSATA
jgi:hypothetical protein